MSVHCEIPHPFRCWVENKLFYNGKQIEDTPYSRCTVFDIASHRGEIPTFSARIDGHGGLFHHIPIDMMCWKQPLLQRMSYHELVYFNCPDYCMALNVYQYLQGSARVFLGDKSYQADYILTLDWYEANENTHLLALETGQYCLMPSHKVLFKSDADILPAYQKLRNGKWEKQG